MIASIQKVYVRTYSDTGQVTAYVEWTDHRGQKGRTEGTEGNAHMQALIARGAREGVVLTRETW